MEGFGIKYHIAYQVLGVNPNTSIFAISQGTAEPTYDIRFWIWESTEYQWMIKSVGHESMYYKLELCTDPLVQGLWFILHDSRMFMLYPRTKTPGEQRLEMEFLHLSADMSEELILQACYDEGWRRIE